jgi:hypothetical protein
MARVTAPLFSAAASGKFSDLAEFRMVNGQAIAAGIKERRKPLHPQTVAQSERFKVAAAEWSALTTAQKQPWRSAAYSQSMTGYQLYMREYLRQGITPPAQPVVPV